MASVVGLDNCLVDILLRVSDAQLESFGLKKGMINFPPGEVLDTLKTLDAEKVCPGGCAANTLSLLSQLGLQAALVGKIGDDAHGELFAGGLRGIQNRLVVGEGDTGVAITLITPDAQRTFALSLGVSNTLTPEELPGVSGDLLYVSTYYLTDPLAGTAAQELIARVRRHGGRLALDLSDPSVVGAEKDRIWKTLKNDVSIVFANELEARALTGKDPEEACYELAEHCEIAIVKIGERGSLIREEGHVTHVPAHVVPAVDTTGAGDAYAAGFLFGWLRKWPLEMAGGLGSLLASRVVQQIGARLDRLPEAVKEFSQRAY